MQLIYEKLPQDISDRHVLLLDPILGTGLSILIFGNVSSSRLLNFESLCLIVPCLELIHQSDVTLFSFGFRVPVDLWITYSYQRIQLSAFKFVSLIVVGHLHYYLQNFT